MAAIDFPPNMPDGFVYAAPNGKEYIYDQNGNYWTPIQGVSVDAYTKDESDDRFINKDVSILPLL